MSNRLTKEDWISCGLKSLLKTGFKSLRVGSLAKILGVSRGSFYWHFKDIADFETQLMTAWQQRTTQSVITELASELSAENRLIELVTLALSEDLSLDAAMRSWSLEDKRANKVVAIVDKQRSNYVESLLLAIGVDKKAAVPRAQLLYWSCVGKSVTEQKPKLPFSKSEIKRLVRMFLVNL